jgi:hypothetical protein
MTPKKSAAILFIHERKTIDFSSFTADNVVITLFYLILAKYLRAKDLINRVQGRHPGWKDHGKQVAHWT